MYNTVLNWSSGKDAALALHYLLQDNGHNVAGLLTTLSDTYGRVSMHGTQETILDMQADSIGLPLQKIRLPENAGMDTYNDLMAEAVTALKARGAGTMAFGDIFLEDLRQYRESQLAKAGMGAVFPLWKKDTVSLVQEVEDTGIKAMIVCVNDRFLGKEFLGKFIGRELLKTLPGNVDPCGEHGEFHTLVIDAPYFKEALPVRQGTVVYKKYEDGEGKWDSGFYYLDVLPL